MFVRRTQTRRTENGQDYFSHRLVRSERIGGKVRQRTLLNLGRHFDIPQWDWPRLCVRIEELPAEQHALIPDDSAALEQEAQHYDALGIHPVPGGTRKTVVWSPPYPASVRVCSATCDSESS